MSTLIASGTPRQSHYFPHIDGLRALAVLSVMFFHLEWSWIPGGFVGVDIFFVISGYLITKLLREELDRTGTLKLSNFYIRRIRRLLPALLVMLLLTVFTAALFLSPNLFERFGNTLTYAVVGLSNHVFWFEADYFDVSAKLKPLLHTWSLSVEEQFYFVWPSLMLLCYVLRAKRWLPCVLLGLGLCSILLNVLFINGHGPVFGELLPTFEDALANSKASMFFLSPFRVFEFAIGALLVWLPLNTMKAWMNDCLLWLGLCLIGISVFTFDEYMLFPGYAALLPCLGTALVIASGAHAKSRGVLTNQFCVRTGLISYSLYLYHWPIIVFWGYIAIRPISLIEQLLIVALSFLCGFVSYRWVEQPFRRGGLIARPDVRKLAVVGCVLAFILTGSQIKASQGWPWRIELQPPLSLAKSNEGFHRSEYGGATFPSVGRIDSNSDRVDLVIVGDSHGKHYAEGLYREYTEPNKLNILMSAGLSCLHLPGFTRTSPGDWDTQCPSAVANVIENVHAQPIPPVVVMSHSWVSQLQRAGLIDNQGRRKARAATMEDVFEGILEFKRAIGAAPLVVIGQVPAANGWNMFDLLTRPNAHLYIDLNEYSRTPLNPTYRDWNNALRKMAQESGAFTFFDPGEVLCEQDTCSSLDPNNQPYYSDGSHLSKLGSKVVVRGLLANYQDLM